MVDILIPTKRWNAYTRAFFSYMASIVTYSDLELQLHIGDNSLDADKHQFLNSLVNERVHVYPHETDLGAYGNLSFLIQNSHSPYVQLFGDDDWIHADWYENIHYFQEMPELSGVIGALLCYPSENKHVVQPGDRFMQADGVARARDFILYMLNEIGVNIQAFSIRRREDFQIFSNYLDQHPFHYQFHDQLLSQIGLLRGPMKGVNNGLIVYNTKHDAISSGAMANYQNTFLEQGLPEWFGTFHFYLYGVGYATLYQFRELSDTLFQNRQEATDQIFALFFNAYRVTPEIEAHLNATGLLPYVQEVYANPTAAQGVASMHKIIAALNSELGEKYAHFLNTYTYFKV